MIKKINASLIKKATGLKIKSVLSCESTFDELDDNDVIIARCQSKGRGRGDHTFYSPLGGIYIVMRETGLNIAAHTLTPAVGIAAHDAINTVLGIDTRLKWVNDVMLDGKKAAGILVRSPRIGEYLIGIGVNYATDGGLLRSAGLYDAVSLDAPADKADLFAAQLIKNIHLATLKNFDVSRYNSLCITVGKNVGFTHNGVYVQGFAESVGSDGTLTVRLGQATVAVDAGEVSVLREVDKNTKDLDD